MVQLTGLEPVLSNLRQILSLLCLPFHHSGALFISHPSSKPQSNTGGSNRRDAEIQEKRNSKSRLIATGFQKGVPNDPSDFKLFFLFGTLWNISDFGRTY